MSAIQSRPQLYSGKTHLNATMSLPPAAGKPKGSLGRASQSQSRHTASDAYRAPHRPWQMMHFAGAFCRRVADHSLIISDAFQRQAPDPRWEENEKSDPVKLKLAQELSEWMVNTLNQKEAVAAVVSRNGNAQAQRHDATGMAHSGLALKDPHNADWIIYNLLHDVPHDTQQSRFLDWISGLRPTKKSPPAPAQTSLPVQQRPGKTHAPAEQRPAISAKTADHAIPTSSGNPFQRQSHPDNPTPEHSAQSTQFSSTQLECLPSEKIGPEPTPPHKKPQSHIWRSQPLEFFYSQPVEKKDALLMVPPQDLQIRLREGVLNGQYKTLYFTPNYNLVSHPHSNTSLNCNKWVLMNLLAAKQGDYSPTRILKAIQAHFKPGRIRMHPILRPIAKIHPTIIPQEVPVIGPIHTVTVESLYRSDLFEEKEFHVPRTLK